MNNCRVLKIPEIFHGKKNSYAINKFPCTFLSDILGTPAMPKELLRPTTDSRLQRPFFLEQHPILIRKDFICEHNNVNERVLLTDRMSKSHPSFGSPWVHHVPRESRHVVKDVGSVGERCSSFFRLIRKQEISREVQKRWVVEIVKVASLMTNRVRVRSSSESVSSLKC